MASPLSPSNEITFRPTTASPPSFSGLTPILPTAIRQLRQHNPPAKPSEMTILANRLRVVHLDQSPVRDVSPHMLPQKLSFSEQLSDLQSPPFQSDSVAGVSSDKENPQNRDSRFGVNEDSSMNPSPSHLASVESYSSTASRTAFSVAGLTKTIETPITLLTSVPNEPELPPVTSHLKTEGTSSTSTAPAPTCVPHKGQNALERNCDTPSLLQHIDRIMHGKTRYNWPERSESLKALASAVSNDRSEDVTLLLLERLSTLAPKIGEHLGELRPSIITSALQLINAIIKSPLPSDEFIASVLPYITTVACEHSLKANDAVYSLILALNKHTSPSLLVARIDNTSRLEKVFRDYIERKRFSEDDGSSAKRALKHIVQKPSESISTLTPMSHAVTPLSIGDPSNDAEKNVPASRCDTPSETKNNQGSALEVTPISEPEQRIDLQRSVDRVKSLRLSRMSWRAKLESPALSNRGISIAGDSKKRTRFDEKPLADDSVPSSSSTFQGRAYSKEEVEEIRQAAIEAVIEKLEHEYREERERIQKEKNDTERELEKERSDNGELRNVLEEYEVTMKQMVSQTNSKLNAHQTALESENTRLKSELQATSEAFDKLKEKYETTKQAVERMEMKEGRLVEQIQELKKNMVELQNWSNDLKANTEKKLTKAFESVTSYRAMYMDKEAHERKAISDAEKLRLELEKSTENLRETAGKLSHCEGELHKEQDARADLAGQLSSAKATILRLTTQRETSQQKLDQDLKVISGMKQYIGELEGKVARMGDAKKQLDQLRVERQELKARAFDDMKRIESMEREMNMKDKELEEMNAICDQAVGELERWKHARST